MARNPKQDANLKCPSTSEARERGRKGGRSSARTRAAMKNLKEVLMEEITEEDQRAMVGTLIKNAKRGHLPSLEFLLRIMGQHPDQGDAFGDGEITICIKGTAEDIEEYAN